MRMFSGFRLLKVGDWQLQLALMLTVQTFNYEI